MDMSFLVRLAVVTVRVPSLTEVVRGSQTSLPLTEVSNSQWFMAICLLKAWLRTAGV